MQNEEQKREEETKVLKPYEMMKDGRVISFGDLSTVENAKGEIDFVSAIIPQCCREGWDSCPHVPKRFKQSKTNIGL